METAWPYLEDASLRPEAAISYNCSMHDIVLSGLSDLEMQLAHELADQLMPCSACRPQLWQVCTICHMMWQITSNAKVPAPHLPDAMTCPTRQCVFKLVPPLPRSQALHPPPPSPLPAGSVLRAALVPF